ncbi:MAG: iron chelate uptake ABC transporter family permease subunit, partial [Pantoea sp.]|nr:iron chelate uptake ABC transporter family permease subunit [Pantoea sp.]
LAQVYGVEGRIEHCSRGMPQVMIDGLVHDALVLSLASVASKNLIPGVIIPVGIVTSLIGVPFFLSIILRHRGTV